MGCVIIDANVAAKFFELSHEDVVPLWSWIDDRGARIATGGKNWSEITKIEKYSRLLFELKRSGKIINYGASAVDVEERKILAAGVCTSNDQHMIALAKVSGARVLYSHDAALIEDFKNKTLIDKPRGKIYSSKRNVAVLKSNLPKCR
jgi:hypothetical protein